METKYKVTNKETGEVSSVTQMAFGGSSPEQYVEATLENGTVITFQNPNAEGNMTNDEYTIEVIPESIQEALPE